MESSAIIQLFADCIREALPFTVLFWMGDMIVSTILRAAFGGKLVFKGTV